MRKTGKNKESIVFGIFGSWGEGKTSVLNFIKNEITKSPHNFIQVPFNGSPSNFGDYA
jgi:predicted KAP-like P-loop ATPase